MVVVTNKHINEKFMGGVFSLKDPTALAFQLLDEDDFRVAATMFIDKQFELYGQSRLFRSVIVGDIVKVNGIGFLCTSTDWTRI